MTSENNELKPVIFFRGLNGIRAVAAMAVLFSHITMNLNSFGLNSFIFGRDSEGNPMTTTLAGFGVSMFFSLSGFLITYLLLEEKRVSEIGVGHFYVRRILRIWPLYYLYLLLAVLTSIVFGLSLQPASILFYVFLMANVPFIFGGAINFLGHYWSLGVEEQFYSFWPWIVRKSKSILTTTIFSCLFLITLKFVLRYRDIQTVDGGMTWPYLALHVTRFQCMLIGAIGAILYFQNNKLLQQVANNYIAQSISWIVIFLAAINKFHIASFLDNEIISTITVIIIIGQICGTHRIINLDNLVLERLGKISYGIYVIHPLMIFFLTKAVTFTHTASFLDYFLVYVVAFFGTILVAYLSFEFFERKFLALKDKYSVIRSLGNRG